MQLASKSNATLHDYDQSVCGELVACKKSQQKCCIKATHISPLLKRAVLEDMNRNETK